ncbi:MAG: efflux RND transporter periplasmic adaptor subunit [Desulfobacterales bacterium]|nr:efflux RND transporter periplasmic adaptor subunit [Desulfobacterales bacterium]
MSRLSLKWAFAVVAVVALVLLVWRGTRPDPVGVTLQTVTRGTVERTVANTRAGTVKACRRAKLSPSIGGQIAALPIKKGDQVKAGQLLLELWNVDLKAQALLAEREVEAAKSRAHAACLKAEVAQRSAQRLVQLRQKDVVTEDRTENAVAEATALGAECQARRTEIGVIEAKVAVSRANIARTQLLAPFDGVIAEITGELFEFVTPSPIGIPTPPAVDIIDNACFYVAAPIDEVDAAGIRVDMPARITMDAFRDYHFQGRVRRIADYVLDLEKQARTVEVEVAFENITDKDALLAGYSADIEVILDTRAGVVRVPTEAITEGRTVYVLEDGRLTARTVKAGLSNWQWTEVIEGLAAEEQVVLNVDAPGLRDGVRAVRLEETP